MLCVREIDRGECQFIPLQKHIDELYNFKVSANRKAIFVAEKHGEDVSVCQYTITGEHKSVSLTN